MSVRMGREKDEVKAGSSWATVKGPRRTREVNNGVINVGFFEFVTCFLPESWFTNVSGLGNEWSTERERGSPTSK